MYPPRSSSKSCPSGEGGTPSPAAATARVGGGTPPRSSRASRAPGGGAPPNAACLHPSWGGVHRPPAHAIFICTLFSSSFPAFKPKQSKQIQVKAMQMNCTWQAASRFNVCVVGGCTPPAAADFRKLGGVYPPQRSSKPKLRQGPGDPPTAAAAECFLGRTGTPPNAAAGFSDLGEGVHPPRRGWRTCL